MRRCIRKVSIKLILAIASVAMSGSTGYAQEINVSSLEKIRPVTSLVKAERGVTLTCADGSQVQLTVLAPDLIRVRASFTKPLPANDHS